MDIHYFDISLIKHCTLHVLNLKMVLIANGSSLPLGRTPGLMSQFALFQGLCWLRWVSSATPLREHLRDTKLR